MKEGALSVVLIAHNEEGNIVPMVTGLLSSYGIEIGELIVVDDASTDRTASLVEKLMSAHKKLRIVKRTPPCGVGRALKDGIVSVSAHAQYILTMDSDFVDSIPEVRRLIEEIEKGCDGVIGSRFIKGGRLIGYPRLRFFTNSLYHFIVRHFFRIKQKDLTNNFKLYKKEIFQDFSWKSDDFAMNAETGLLPILWGYRIHEVPVSWVRRKTHMGRSKLNACRHSWGYITVIPAVLRTIKERKQKMAVKAAPFARQ